MYTYSPGLIKFIKTYHFYENFVFLNVLIYLISDLRTKNIKNFINQLHKKGLENSVTCFIKFSTIDLSQQLCFSNIVNKIQIKNIIKIHFPQQGCYKKMIFNLHDFSRLFVKNPRFEYKIFLINFQPLSTKNKEYIN